MSNKINLNYKKRRHYNYKREKTLLEVELNKRGYNINQIARLICSFEYEREWGDTDYVYYMLDNAYNTLSLNVLRRISRAAMVSLQQVEAWVMEDAKVERMGQVSFLRMMADINETDKAYKVKNIIAYLVKRQVPILEVAEEVINRYKGVFNGTPKTKKNWWKGYLVWDGSTRRYREPKTESELSKRSRKQQKPKLPDRPLRED
jgi:hypothetical protein